jgi:2-iminoacetate synthase ThiH
MYGHLETVEEYLDHIIIIHKIRKRPEDFSEIISMSFVSLE